MLCTKAFKQLEAGWCWNAVSQIILDYHDIKVTQCEIANRVYPQQSPCCLKDGRPYAQDTNDPNARPDCGLSAGGFPQYVFDKYAFDYSPQSTPNGQLQLQLLFWSAAVEQIKKDRPYIVWLHSLIGNPSHTLVVHGFSDLMGGARELKVIDPQTNPPDDWFQPWDGTLRSVGSAQVPVGLGDMNNQHTGDISDIQP
ncbi:MAG: C39 family peptidase [Nitrospira sp.]|nr:C39 family peptidase [Nitrospira sp.]